MSAPYTEMLERLHHSILTRSPEHIRPYLTHADSLADRLNVYIGGYRIRLRQAVIADYPALAHYLSTQHMDKLVHAYIEAVPSMSYTLDRYPIGFAAYLEKTCDDRFAIALATLESAIAETFWRPDSEAFAPPPDLTPEALMALTLPLRAAGKLLVLEYPTDTYLAAQRAGGALAAPEPSASHMYIVRHRNEVKRHTLAYGEYLILSALGNGMTVGSALQHIETEYPDTVAEVAANLESWMSRWIVNGFFRS